MEKYDLSFDLIHGFIVSSCLPRGNGGKQMAPAVKLSKESESLKFIRQRDSCSAEDKLRS